MEKFIRILIIITSGCCLGACSSSGSSEPAAPAHSKVSRQRLIIDTDTNNELDDQHALAYALYNQDVFSIEGITINNTRGGNGMQGHYKEALRILKLCNAQGRIPVRKGAVGIYSDISQHVNETTFDGKEAVDFIIERSMAQEDNKLTILAIGKLTNIALALKKAPEIKQRVKIVWLGSNYPAAGEYNLDNDTTAVNPVIQSGVPFEMVPVRYGETTGTAAVTVTKREIEERMPSKGIKIKPGIKGRNGGVFNTFGDYSVDLFDHAEMNGNPPSRALYDLAAVAILKDPQWAQKTSINAPVLMGDSWVENPHPDNENNIWIWQNFNRNEIINDLFLSIEGQ